MLLKNVSVTAHAMSRWRERASRGALDTVETLIDAVRESRLLESDEHMPIAREADTHYYLSTEHNCFFVVEPVDRESARIVTVIANDGGARAPILTPKKRVKSLPKCLAEFTGTLEEQYIAMTKKRQEIADDLADMNKTDQRRPALKFILQAIDDRLKTVRPEYKAWRREQLQKDEMGVYRADGEVNYGPALKFLLAKVAELERQIHEMRAGKMLT